MSTKTPRSKSTPIVSKKNVPAPKKTRDASGLAKMSRAKGKVWERAVANLLHGVYPDARRSHGQSRTKGEAPDVMGTEFWIECKDHRTLNARKALEQAIAERATRKKTSDLVAAGVHYTPSTNGAPVVVMRHTGKRPDMAIMVLEDWLRLVSEVVRLRKTVDAYIAG